MRTQGKPAMATPKENMKMKMKETISQEVVEAEMGRDTFASLSQGSGLPDYGRVLLST